MILIKNVEVYSPQYKGKKDVFVSGGKISLIEDKINFDSEKIISKAQQSEVFSLNYSSSLEDFINSISSIAFAEALKELGFEVQIIVFLMYRGFNAKEAK